MTADMEANETISPIVTELFLREGKLHNSFVFISEYYFIVPKTVRLDVTHHFIMKIPNKRELQQQASNHSSDIKFKDSILLYKNNTKETF